MKNYVSKKPTKDIKMDYLLKFNILKEGRKRGKRKQGIKTDPKW